MYLRDWKMTRVGGGNFVEYSLEISASCSACQRDWQEKENFEVRYGEEEERKQMAITLLKPRYCPHCGVLSIPPQDAFPKLKQELRALKFSHWKEK